MYIYIYIYIYIYCHMSHNSIIRVTWLICTCVVIYSHVWHSLGLLHSLPYSALHTVYAGMHVCFVYILTYWMDVAYLCVFVCVCECVHTCVYACVRAGVFSCVYVFVRVCTCACVRACPCVCVRVLYTGLRRKQNSKRTGWHRRSPQGVSCQSRRWSVSDRRTPPPNIPPSSLLGRLLTTCVTLKLAVPATITFPQTRNTTLKKKFLTLPPSSYPCDTTQDTHVCTFTHLF